jgi:hypothetical protein
VPIQNKKKYIFCICGVFINKVSQGSQKKQKVPPVYNGGIGPSPKW